MHLDNIIILCYDMISNKITNDSRIAVAHYNMPTIKIVQSKNNRVDIINFLEHVIQSIKDGYDRGEGWELSNQ